MIHDITLRGYNAVLPGGRRELSLGTHDSYGIEQLRVQLGEDWQSLTVTATFVVSGVGTRVLLGEDGVIDVPPEATQKAGGATLHRCIVFSGTADGIRRISTDLPYRIAPHSAIEGPESEATPGLLEQILAKVEQGGTGLPPGGTTGDILVKQSETDGDAAWQNTEVTDEEVLTMLLSLDLAPAATSDGAVLTDENGNILLW